MESFIFSKLSLDLRFTVEFRFNNRIVLIRHRIFRMLLDQIKKKLQTFFFLLKTGPACLNALLSSSSFVQCTRRVRTHKRYLSKHAAHRRAVKKRLLSVTIDVSNNYNIIGYSIF